MDSIINSKSCCCFCTFNTESSWCLTIVASLHNRLFGLCRLLTMKGHSHGRTPSTRWVSAGWGGMCLLGLVIYLNSDRGNFTNITKYRDFSLTMYLKTELYLFQPNGNENKNINLEHRSRKLIDLTKQIFNNEHIFSNYRQPVLHDRLSRD